MIFGWDLWTVEFCDTESDRLGPRARKSAPGYPTISTPYSFSDPRIASQTAKLRAHAHTPILSSSRNNTISASAAHTSASPIGLYPALPTLPHFPCSFSLISPKHLMDTLLFTWHFGACSASSSRESVSALFTIVLQGCIVHVYRR